MIETDNYALNFQSTAFLEPFTADVDSPIKNGKPALMYGTQLSEEGLKCAIPGFDYNKLYNIWSCPRIAMNVAVCITVASKLSRDRFSIAKEKDTLRTSKIFPEALFSNSCQLKNGEGF